MQNLGTPKLGVDFHLYYNNGTDQTPDWKPFARATSNAINLTSNDIDIANKGTGNWDDFGLGRKAYNTPVTGYVYEDEDLDEFKLYDIFNNGVLMIRFGKSVTTDPQNPTLDTTQKYFEGCVKVSGVDISFNDNETVTFTATLNGKGKLDVVDNNTISWQALRTGAGVQFVMSEDFSGATPVKEDVIILDADGKLVAVAADGDVTVSGNLINVAITLTSSVVYGVRLSKKAGFATAKTITQKFANVTG